MNTIGKGLLYIGITGALFSCSVERKDEINELVVSEFQEIIDSKNVQGSILIYDIPQGLYYSNDYNWASVGRLPASTFKIPNSIIALETAVVSNESTMFPWNGEPTDYKIWEQDLTFENAFHYSCVPCYQNVARKIGVKRMSSYLQKLEYTDMKFDSSTIDIFWLEGESKINQFEQIHFLKRFYQSQLKISDRTERILRKMMVMEQTENFKLSGKTGLSVRSGKQNGWFVGFMEAKEHTYIFAINIEPTEDTNLEVFPKLRKEITMEALEVLNIQEEAFNLRY